MFARYLCLEGLVFLFNFCLVLERTLLSQFLVTIPISFPSAFFAGMEFLLLFFFYRSASCDGDGKNCCEVAIGLVSCWTCQLSSARSSVFPGKKIRHFIQPRFPVSTEFRFLCDDDGQTGILVEEGSD